MTNGWNRKMSLKRMRASVSGRLKFLLVLSQQLIGKLHLVLLSLQSAVTDSSVLLWRFCELFYISFAVVSLGSLSAGVIAGEVTLFNGWLHGGSAVFPIGVLVAIIVCCAIIWVLTDMSYAIKLYRKRNTKGFGSMKVLIEDVAGAVATGLFIIGSSMIDVSDPVVVTVGTTVMAALTGAIKVLWDRNNALSKATDIALEKCEQEHAKASAKYDNDIQKASEKYELQHQRSSEQTNVLIQQVIALSGEVGTMKGRIQGYQEAQSQQSNRDSKPVPDHLAS